MTDREAALRAPRPPVVNGFRAEQADPHGAEAPMRSKRRAGEPGIGRSVLPTTGRKIADRSGIEGPPGTALQTRARHAADR